MKLIFISGFISSGLIKAICWTLLHSVWQGLVAAAIAGCIVLVTRRSKAVVRYNLLSIVFAGFIAVTLITFLNESGMTSNLSGGNYASGESLKLSVSTTVRDAVNYQQISVGRKIFFQPFISLGDQYAAFITALWAILFLFNCIKMVAGLRYSWQLRSNGAREAAQDWKERLYTLVSLLGMHTKVILKESIRVKVPVVLGYLKPVILVPVGMFAQLSIEQAEGVLVHELAHIRRQDFLVNLLQRMVEAVFFFNPFVRWLSALLHEEREACCDDIVLEYNADKKLYLEALISFKEKEFAEQRYALALGNTNSLLNRAKRILTNENKKLNAMEKITLMLVVVAVTAFAFIPKQNVIQAVKQTAIAADASKEIELKQAGKNIAVLAAAKDTVPGKEISVKNISVEEDDNGTDKISRVTALVSDGKKYTYTTVNDTISELAVDGVAVEKEKYDEYKMIIDQVENSRRKSRRDALQQQQQQQNLHLQESQKELMDNRQLAMQDKLSHQSDSILLQNKLQAENNLVMQKALQENQHQMVLQNNVHLNRQLKLLQQQQLKMTNKDLQLVQQKFNLEKNEQLNQQLAELKSDQQLLQDKAKSLVDAEYDPEQNVQLKLKLEQQENEHRFSDGKSQLLLENKLNLQNKLQLNHNLQLIKNQQLQLQKQFSQNVLNKLNLSLPVLKNDAVTDIINCLVDAGIVTDRNQLSFTLNSEELIVNGKKQAAGLHAELRSKFIKNKKDHYIYKTDGHSTSTDITNE
jgi:beta-lactamase regulating signal transducer with metallopeptidase domain